MRWDSDHVVILDDEPQEIVRHDLLERVYIGHDYFDASVNRVTAWVIGARSVQKSLLRAMLEPTAKLRALEAEGDFTGRLVWLEELKTYPYAAVWDRWCEREQVPVREAWLAEVKKYEQDVLLIEYKERVCDDDPERTEHMSSDKIAQADFLKETAETARLLWELGWAERNAGNISRLIDPSEAPGLIESARPKKRWPLDEPVAELAGRLFLVTGTGSYFRTIARDPARGLGIVRVTEDGRGVELLWGFEDGGACTSEFPSHLLGHRARLKADPAHRVVIHSHATHLIALSAVCRLDERTFTRSLWKMNSECLVVFPDGVGVLPWMVPGTNELGRRTAEKLESRRLVVWPLHGVVGAGCSLDETVGLLETAEKAAAVYLEALACGRRPGGITDGQLKELARRFQLKPRPGIID